MLVRDSLNVKLLRQEEELYVLACSTGRQAKERAMRCRRLKELQQQKLSRDQLLMKIGAAKKESGNDSRLVELILPCLDRKPLPAQLKIDL